MRGIIDFLISDDSIEAVTLRKNFIFKIVPMVNVDGVKYGNHRCNLSGIDLNRAWKKPSSVLFPEVSSIKKMIQEFKDERRVVMMVDLHGHSIARHAFAYANTYLNNPKQTKLFPFILSKLEQEIFKFSKCTFNVEVSKEGTSRVALWKMLKTPVVFTLETSMCGAGVRSTMPHFIRDNFLKLG